MVNVRVLRVVVTLVVRRCRVFKLLVLLVGVEGVVTIVLLGCHARGLWFAIVIQTRGALGSSRGVVVTVIMVIVSNCVVVVIMVGVTGDRDYDRRDRVCIHDYCM